MNLFLHPRWIFFSTSLPQLVLLIIYYNAYQVFESALKPEIKQNWFLYGVGLGLVVLLQTIFGFWKTYQSKNIDWRWAVSSLVVYTFLLISYASQTESLVPNAIPNWIQSITQVESFVGMFIFPSVLHALLVAAISITEQNNKLKYFDFAVFLVPVLVYSSVMLLNPLFGYGSEYRKYQFFVQAVVWSIIILAVIFWAFRFIYLLFQRYDYFFLRKSLEVLFTLAFPIAGLALSYDMQDPIGNFKSPFFFVLAFVAGVTLLIPSSENPKVRLLHFGFKCLVFPYTLYFFIVFLPFIPLGVVLIIFLVGLLVVTPTVLLLVHVQQLYKDYVFLQSYYSSLAIQGVLVFSIALIPLLYSGMVYNDRIELHKAIDYLYHTNYDEEIDDLSSNSVARVLEHIENHKNRSRNRGWDFNHHNVPLLDEYYRWIVLDNMTLSREKMELIHKVFIGRVAPKYKESWLSRWNWESANRNLEKGTGDNSVVIDSITINSVYDSTMGVWKSQIDLLLHNTSQSSWGQREYATFFDLPDGAFISDYYLYVGDEKVKALLAEKKTALWVYRQIVRRRRDPGILYYNDKGQIGFRVFPFTKNEYRKTGFEVLHPMPFKLKMDNLELSLGKSNTEFEHEDYISAKDLEKASTITPEPYYHFLMDNSYLGGVGKEKYIQKLENFVKKHPLNSSLPAKFTIVDTRAIDVQADWKDAYLNRTNKGGFFLERATKKIWLGNYLHNKNSSKPTQPVIVVLSDELQNGVWAGNNYEWEKYVPQGFGFYQIGTNGRILAHRFGYHQYLGEPTDAINIPEVRKIEQDGQNYYFSYQKSYKEGLVLPSLDEGNFTNFEKQNKYSQALALQHLTERVALYPKEADTRWLEQVQKSFTARILTNVTTFMVLENEMQRKALLEKQKEVLQGKRSLDLDEQTTRRSSEPSFWLILGGVLIFLVWKKRKRLQPKR